MCSFFLTFFKVSILSILHIDTLMFLVAGVVPRTCKIIKNVLFLKEDICNKMVFHALYLC